LQLKKDSNYIFMDGKESVRYVIESKIEGVLVECGVQHGTFQSLWIAELQRLGVERDIYLYDTFAGLTAPGDMDYTTAGATWFTIAARRGGAPIQFFQNWENDAIFCNPNFFEIEVAKNGIVFAYYFAPFNSSN